MAKNGYSEEEIKKLKRAKADPIIAPSKGQVLWEVSVEGPSSEPFIGRKYQHDEVFCYVSTPWENTRRYGPASRDAWWRSVPSKEAWSIRVT